ncbi:dicarboxylate/amino acid:cation symporter [Candidatus Bandiella euplotis]|uniref:Dicarboxylate/amino acid:cation symporter n=1 Tax=Candidatus Bandiella euplotis TaxID=1664265 RepID=A0ABZ0UR50_9RICK|nr:dicarboxylate/amino acid:cation symporter [Candidatus Bandiella woodruffii]WPX96500.1 Dicarboxylate/amino acid:cation symporter [Candidatus Bandiella woodruffii]
MKLSFLRLSPWQKILLALVLGAIVGVLLGEDSQYFSCFGVVFLNLIKMITIPMIFFTIIYGITNIETTQGLRRLSIKSIITFTFTSFLAVSVGIIVSMVLKPGVGISKTILDQFKGSQSVPKVGSMSIYETLIDIIPTNIFSAMVSGHILQVVMFALFIGAILNTARSECSEVIKVCQQSAILFFKVIRSIMRLAPIGVFGYIAAIVATEGIGILVALGKLVATIGIGCLIQYLLFGVLILFVSGVSPIPFYRKIIEPQLLAFATSSSKATLVPLMDVVETKLGVSKQSSRFILPLSAALNMDGGAIYQSACAVFFAQMLGVDFSLSQYVILFVMCTLASIGGAGIPGGVLLFLGMVLNSVGLPIEGVLLIASVDRFLDMMTTVINVTGCACATVLIDHSEKTMDVKLYTSDNSKRVRNMSDEHEGV